MGFQIFNACPYLGHPIYYVCAPGKTYLNNYAAIPMSTAGPITPVTKIWLDLFKVG